MHHGQRVVNARRIQVGCWSTVKNPANSVAVDPLVEVLVPQVSDPSGTRVNVLFQIS